MATYVISINGTPVSPLLGTLSIPETANGANTASFAIESPTGSYRPTIGHPVAITEDGATIFIGYVKSVSESGFGNIGWPDITSTVICEDPNSFATRKTVSGTVAAGNLKSILEFLEPYLTEFGVALSGTQPNGPDIDSITYEYMTVAEALDQLAELTGYIWDISYGYILSMVLPGSVNAPFNIVADDGHCIGDVKVETSMEDYANRVIVRFTNAACAAWGFFTPGWTHDAYTPANVTNGSTVTIGSVTYTFDTTLVDSANHVLIGATIDLTLEYLAAALDATTGEGSVWGTGTTQNSQCWGVIPFTGALRVMAREVGVSGNSIGVSTTVTDTAWGWEGGQEITALDGGRDDTLTITAMAEDLGEIGSMGTWEKVLAQPDIRTYDAAHDLAVKELAKAIASKNKKTVRYTTDYVGDPTLHPGQKQTITLPSRNLSGDFLITDVRVYEGENWLRRDITLQGGTALLNRWQDDAKKALGGGSSASSSVATLSGTSGGTGGGTGGGTVAVMTPIWLGGGEGVRTRCTPANTWVRGFDGVEIILDSADIPVGAAPYLSVKCIADPITSGNAQVQLVASNTDWATQTVCTPAPTAVTDGANWVWQSLAITLQTGVWGYRIEMRSNVNNSDVGFRAILQW